MANENKNEMVTKETEEKVTLMDKIKSTKVGGHIYKHRVKYALGTVAALALGAFVATRPRGDEEADYEYEYEYVDEESEETESE